MLTTAGQDVPNRVSVRFDAAERPLGVLHGLLESGLVFTGRRVFAWRANGVGGPLPLTAIDRILVDTASGADRVDVIVLPRQAMHPPLVLTRRTRDLVPTLEFVARLAGATARRPDHDILGPVHRYAFPEE